MESDWLTSNDFGHLLSLLEERASARKLRLFAVSCARRIVHLLSDRTCQLALEVAEQYADDASVLSLLRDLHVASRGGLESAWHAVPCVERDGNRFFASKDDALAIDRHGVVAELTNEEFDEVSVADVIDCIAGVLGHSASAPHEWSTSAGDDAFEHAVESERPNQLHLFRDVFWNLFRSVVLAPEWVTDSTVSLAREMYEGRDFGAMPILGDALEGAGCDNQEVLAHCRSPVSHVRGCWVVDLVLGRE